MHDENTDAAADHMTTSRDEKRRSTLTCVPLYKLKCCAEVESALVCQRPEEHYSTESL
jgi:hypothetical protein